jgi:hypothetical protein
MADVSYLSLPFDRDDVEAERRFAQAVGGHVQAGGAQDPPPLAGRHRLYSFTVAHDPALLNLDKDGGGTVPGNDVELTTAAPVVPRQDDEAGSLELATRPVLALAPPPGRTTAFYRPRRQRVPRGVSSRTMPRPSSLARAASAFWNSRRLRAS